MQLGRYDELGSGVLNINRYLKAYSGHDNPQFIEGTVFKTIIPLDEKFVDKAYEVDAVSKFMTIVDAVNDAEVDTVPEFITIADAVADAEVDAVSESSVIVDAVDDRINDAVSKTLKLTEKKKPTRS